MQPKKDLQPSWIIRCCATVLLLGQACLHFVQGKTHYGQVLEHMITVGPGSMYPVLSVNFFGGMIFTIQTARELSRFDAVSVVGGAFALAFCRELAPILTASILAGQVGSAFAAEIGAMQVTEQIDALYILKTDPIDYLVLPRMIACCLMLPVVNILSLVVGIFGGLLAAAHFYNMPPEVFLESVRSFLAVSDLLVALLKGLIFGVLIATIGCSWGLTTTRGVKEVGKSATSAVVTTWVAIFIIDLLISIVFFEHPIV
ncbi:MAG: MlaE family lipid ABC transporter permease subunit [Calothrix sp. MO_167.B42]|nr:MlaE family lipid ABC transporter permease subunit [Calothrix sp. MO_167.B42]